MTLRKILTLATIFVMSTQFVFANYAFYKKVTNTCKYYRVTVDEKKMSLTKNANGSYHFSIEMESLRNNFEMVMLVGFISVGQAMNHQASFAKKKSGYTAILPENTEVTVSIPVSRQSTIITAKATAEQIRQLTDGKIDSARFMRLIKDSIQTL
ncbi:MAG: hypothetical protein HOA15_03370 [Candidatus Marinimicrobia bacterium]|jgi:hypothetical protein|nr:hypothetical protein [Candidatus Neomarinimicrobiota bacterium]MBT3676571.1 hypothetical protein [Candidatus Neomarinimicrobiota bacterium]MBT3763307.1 hypothetical protein [Candidatus Neomarinimicrobiota bacterium]MBT4067301.1 hypothetical protein [Candidatus Neomarinimicrobiota bacterium]MBT4270599.1 hypothetical protein [Candidatus Neomarinimicrobiota bacterium]